jgi:ubiquinone/menaquinone biosynthesis C-methylase UbiE
MFKHLARPVYHILYRCLVRVRCYCEDLCASNHDLPPAMLRFRVSESVSENLFVAIGKNCARLIAGLLTERGQANEGARVLDFGCGCGRTIKWLIEDHPEALFSGCDIDPEAILWCQDHLPHGTFQVNAAMPPLEYESSYFDAVYCFSVFTHLNETMQDAWLAELRRIVKPNGVLIITVHGYNAARCLSEVDRRVLQSTGFLHKTSRKLSGFLPDWYHTTWHSQSYILGKLTSLFGKATYIAVIDGLQDCVVAGGSLDVQARSTLIHQRT